MTFFNPIWLYVGVAALILAAGVSVWSDKSRRRLLSKFVSPKLLGLLSSSLSRGRIVLKHTLVCIGIFALFFALARPQYGYVWQEAKSRGIDIVFALDASKSMLAQDVKPDRLSRAKLAITDMLQKLKGDRIGLVAFSGQAFLQCPMTLDYHAFEMSLDAVSTKIIQRGGTNISAAIKEAENAFAGTVNHKIIVLISDGEELEDEAVSTAKAAAARGVVIYTLGVGNSSGEPVPVPDEYGRVSYVKDENGRVITSRLNEKTLEQIAKETGGFYANLSDMGMDKIYEDGLKKIPQEELSARMRHTAIERFQIPLAVALILLSLECLIGTRKLFAARARNKASRNALLGALALTLLCLPQISKGGDSSELVDTSNSNAPVGAIVDAPMNKTREISPEALQSPEQQRAPEKPAEPEKAKTQKFEPTAKSTPREVFNAAVDAQSYGDLAHAKKLYTHAVKISEDTKFHAKAYFNTAVADYAQAKQAYEKIPSIAEFQNAASTAETQNNACINGGMEILREAAPLLKEEKEFYKNNPQAKEQSAATPQKAPSPLTPEAQAEKMQQAQKRPQIENEQFQQKVKQAVSQCEAAQKAAEQAEAKNAEISGGAKSVAEILSECERNFESAKVLDADLPQVAQNIKNVKGVENALEKSVNKNDELIAAIKKSSDTLKKVTEELKKLLRDKQDNNQNKDNQQQNQNQNQDNKQNQDKQNQQQNQQNKDNQQNQNQDKQDNNQQNKDNSDNQQNQDKQDQQQNQQQDNQQNQDKQQKENQKQNSEENGSQNQEQKDGQNKDGQNAPKEDKKESPQQKDDSGNSQNERQPREGQSPEQKEQAAKPENEKVNPDDKPKEETNEQAAENQAKKEDEKSPEETAAQATEQAKEQKPEEKQARGASVGEESKDEKDENYRSAEGVMTRREAVQMLDSLKSDEKRLPFRGYGEVQNRYEEKKYKDW